MPVVAGIVWACLAVQTLAVQVLAVELQWEPLAAEIVNDGLRCGHLADILLAVRILVVDLQ